MSLIKLNGEWVMSGVEYHRQFRPTESSARRERASDASKAKIAARHALEERSWQVRHASRHLAAATSRKK